MNSCNIVINQQRNDDEVKKVIEVKKKHPGRVAQGHKLAELMRLRKLGLAPQKNKPETLKGMLQEIRKDLSDPASILTAFDETIRILKENKIEIQITLKKI